ncbi:SUF system Fe-S cluster assembly protein [Inmirania thermothiophila]|uniref:FeS assembly SUF system protein n=1 Tax=Inmirania thermothiophila TaxID=1750597 RepID=A0A3N1Y247_9GAMM|nr:SUF system Fe-S cluster assembly protein [Inmirania thermothiophila]ROR32598.1 FeS assembly SUF system protein [Inmirania thermothiophila]
MSENGKAPQQPRVDPAQLESDIVAALQNVYDPEIPVNIYDLGLIYTLEVSPEGDVYIEMTLTAPGCPVAQTFPDMVASHVRAVPGVRDVRVELVWDPPWTKDRMSESARLQLGFF